MKVIFTLNEIHMAQYVKFLVYLGIVLQQIDLIAYFASLEVVNLKI